jgi:hypothetical protein
MSAQSDLYANLKAYQEGLASSIALAKTGTFNDLSLAAAQVASKTVPGASQAIALANGLKSGVASVLGQGSTLARVVSAGLSGNALLTLPNVLKAAFGGRTYQSDQYWGAVLYRFYVKGEANITNQNQIADSDVIEALRWFINKTGVYISGREHLYALRKGRQAYMAYYGVNKNTTMDPVLVDNAVAVVQQYMGSDNGMAGSWANTVGVYDNALVQALNAADPSLSVVQAGKAAGAAIQAQQAAAAAALPVAGSVGTAWQQQITLLKQYWWVPVVVLIGGIVLIKIVKR